MSKVIVKLETLNELGIEDGFCFIRIDPSQEGSFALVLTGDIDKATAFSCDADAERIALFLLEERWATDAMGPVVKTYQILDTDRPKHELVDPYFFVKLVVYLEALRQVSADFPRIQATV